MKLSIATLFLVLLTACSGGESARQTPNNNADAQAPTAPISLRVTNVTSSSVALTWEASTDNVGVTGYDVLRDATTVGTATATNSR